MSRYNEEKMNRFPVHRAVIDAASREPNRYVRRRYLGRSSVRDCYSVAKTGRLKVLPCDYGFLKSFQVEPRYRSKYMRSANYLANRVELIGILKIPDHTAGFEIVASIHNSKSQPFEKVYPISPILVMRSTMLVNHRKLPDCCLRVFLVMVLNECV